jgi:hypothetical protein
VRFGWQAAAQGRRKRARRRAVPLCRAAALRVLTDGRRISPCGSTKSRILLGLL